MLDAVRRSALALIVVAGCVRWSKTNTALEAAFVVEQAIDYRQTSQAVMYGAENNPVIGAWGENVSPAAYFLTTTLMHAFVVAALPARWRLAFQGASVTGQGWEVYRNEDALEFAAANGCAAIRDPVHACH